MTTAQVAINDANQFFNSSKEHTLVLYFTKSINYVTNATERVIPPETMCFAVLDHYPMNPPNSIIKVGINDTFYYYDGNNEESHKMFGGLTKPDIVVSDDLTSLTFDCPDHGKFKYIKA
jgi:hypothetical protein